jgi:uncharacterized membrane protein
MNLGPVELIVIAFPDGKLHKDVAPALKEIVDNGTCRIIDLLFVRKDEEGNIKIVELEDSGVAEAFKNVDGDVYDLINASDVETLAQELPNGSAAALVVWENTWASKFAEAVRASKGRVVTNLRVPNSVVEAALQAMEEVKVNS